MSLIFSEGGVSGVTEEELQAAVDALQSQIDTISAASDVADIVGTYTDLQNYDTSSLSDKAIVKVLNDSTHDGAPSYYRWSTTTDTFTYIGSESRVNDGTLTISQGDTTLGTFSANSATNESVSIPTTVSANDATITFMQGDTSLGSITTNQSVDETITIPTPPSQAQANWNESDNTDPSFIQNKPTIPIVSQVFDGTSTDAQSGVAIQNAGFLNTIPAVSPLIYNEYIEKPAITELTNNNTQFYITDNKLGYNHYLGSDSYGQTTFDLSIPTDANGKLDQSKVMLYKADSNFIDNAHTGNDSIYTLINFQNMGIKKYMESPIFGYLDTNGVFTPRFVGAKHQTNDYPRGICMYGTPASSYNSSTGVTTYTYTFGTNCKGVQSDNNNAVDASRACWALETTAANTPRVRLYTWNSSNNTAQSSMGFGTISSDFTCNAVIFGFGTCAPTSTYPAYIANYGICDSFSPTATITVPMIEVQANKTLRLNVGSGLDIQNNDLIANKATSSTVGVVKPDENTIHVDSAGTLSTINMVKSTSITNIVAISQTDYDEIGTYYAYVYDTSTVYVRTTTPTTSTTVYSAIDTESALTIDSVSTGTITLSDGNTYTYTSSSNIVDSTAYSSTTLYIVSNVVS